MGSVPDPPIPPGVAVVAAVDLAARLLVTGQESTTSRERRQADRLGGLLGDPAGRELLFALTDQVLRTPSPERSMAQLRQLVERGLPDALPHLDRVALRLAAVGARLAPRPVAAIVRRRLKAETSGVIVPAGDPAFTRHVAARRAAGFAVNVNLLGEAILGDGEADDRLAALIARMRRPDVDYVSVKISALCANVDPLAFDHEVDRIADRLRAVYDVAVEHGVFVNLDMEEYRDLDLTVAAFRRVLDEDRYRGLRAGIVLQAYLPDTHDVVAELAAWAEDRHRRGGAPIKVRLVKGANLAMELADAELGGWTPAPYGSKADVDASYKALLDHLLDAAAGGALTVGVGSHNLFDIAWALGERTRRGLEDAVAIEMLEGMAPPQSRAGARPDRRGAAVHAGRRRRRLRCQHRLPVAAARRERRTGELPPRPLHDLDRLAGMGRRGGPLHPGGGRAQHRADRAAPDAGPSHRDEDVRPRGGVRQRARHRLHADRQPAVGAASTSTATGRRTHPR